MKSKYAVVCLVSMILILVCILMVRCGAESVNYIDINDDYSKQQEIKENAHEMANHARALKIPEDSVIIQTASDIWIKADKTQRALTMLSSYTENDEYYLSKTMYAEARGSTEYELSKVAWCILNRVDATGSSIQQVVTAPNQFAYRSYINGEDYLYLAKDVLLRYCMEKCGIEDCGRTLPNDYMQFRGDGKLNHFYKTFNDARKGINEYTNWLNTPYGV
jgi:hypothetical protein